MCKHSFNYHAYMVTPQDFEFDARLLTPDGPVRVLVAKVGGGDPDRAYEGSWYYRVDDLDGKTLFHGDDLVTGSPKSHAQVARLALELLADGASA